MPEPSRVIRPEMSWGDVRSRGAELRPDQKAALRRGLRTLHTLEIMATKIYSCQISTRPCELNTSLTAAMCNEMTHMQDFQTKLYEHGFKPSKVRWAYWIMGYVLGLGSRLMGARAVLRIGVWAEDKAVRHYGELLETVPWDDETRAIVARDQSDESEHIATWESFLDQDGPIC